MAGPLSHIRVLDLSRVLAGPWAGQNLADLGAEVIKIERPKQGDDSRAFGPPWVKDGEGKDTRESAYFTSANRGKKSVTLNLSSAQGQQIVRDLAKHADVLIENYKFGEDLLKGGLVLPALEYCLKCSHMFNLLDSSGSVGVTERTAYILRVRQLALAICKAYVEEQASGLRPQAAGEAK